MRARTVALLIVVALLGAIVEDGRQQKVAEEAQVASQEICQDAN